jgi:diguanylate cyclase (GGDEF)-like protein
VTASRPLLAILLLAGSLLCFAAPAGAAEDYQSLLDSADELRSSEPGRFQSLLGELNARVQEATPAQRQQLRYLKAYELGYTGRFDLAAEAAIELMNEVDDPRLRLRAGALIVNSYAIARNFPEGLRYLDQTLLLIDRVPDTELRSHAWFAAASLYTQLGQHELSRHYAERVLEASTVPRTRCFAGLQRLEAMLHLGELAENDAETRALVDLCDAQREVLVANLGRTLLARQWARKGEHGAAIAMLEPRLLEIESTRYPRLVGDALSVLAELNLALGQHAQAEAYAQQAVRQSHDIAFSLPLVNAHRVLYEVALARGDSAAALGHYRRYAEADKAYLDSIKAREQAYLTIKHETAQKNQTIELLNNQNRVLQLEQQVSAKSTQATQLLVALLCVLLASIAYWAVKIKRMQVSFRRLAETDALTGISNRLHFSRQAEQALDYCRRNREDAVLVMFDLDEFKAINDQHGHAMGDWVLQQVSAACGRVGRKHDLFGRLGGEEFAFLMVGADAKAGTQLAQQCRENITAIDTSNTGARFRVTASFGVAATSDASYDFQALLARADEAMYRSKRDGRDRVTVHGPATPTPDTLPA